MYVVGHLIFRVGPELRDLARYDDGRAFADFDCYAQAARQAAQGESIYRASEVPPHKCVFTDLPPYIYPPALAVALRPVASVRHCTLERAWLLLNIVALFACIPLLMAVLKLRTEVAWCLVTFVVVAPMATLENLTLGQINLHLLVLALGSWWLAGRGFGSAAVGLVAWAASLKVIPALWLVEGFRRAGIRAAFWSVAATVALSAITFAFVPDDPLAMVRTLADRSTESATTNDASLVAALERAFGWPTRFTLAVNSLLVVSLLAWIGIRARKLAPAPEYLALILALGLASLPLLEAHHLVLLIPAHLVLGRAAWGQPRWRRRLLGLAFVVGAFVFLNSRGFVLNEPFPRALADLLAKPAWLGVWSELLALAWLSRNIIHREYWSSTHPSP